jgi:hypothetical protein
LFSGSNTALLQLPVKPVTPVQKLLLDPDSILTPAGPERIRELMKIWIPLLLVALLAGCTGVHPRGTARYDNFDAVKVEQMVGNNVSSSVFAKTIVCLNARRETRLITALTNTVVTTVTNPPVITPVTNLTITFATNFLWTTMTNLEAAEPGQTVAVAGEIAPGAVIETNVTAAVGPTNTGSRLGTNLTISVANNNSGAVAPNQRVANSQVLRTFQSQLSSRSNNLAFVLATNIVVTGETNQIVTFLTNISVMSVTNHIVTPTNGVDFDYFLYTELIPPQDFTLATGESLILLVDGVRYGFTNAPSGTAFVARRGYTSNLYRATPEALVAIANAREVKIRFKGVNNVVERTMNSSSRQNFRRFVTKYFVPAAPAEAPETVAALNEATRNSNR